MKLRPGGEIHDVVLVDPRRARQQRDGAHPLGLRRVLDQLHEVVAEDYPSRGCCEVPAQLERCRVDLARASAVVRQIVEEIAGAGEQAGAAGLECLLNCGRVGGQEIRRGKGVEAEAGG
jgi:hypothetical protein